MQELEDARRSLRADLDRGTLALQEGNTFLAMVMFSRSMEVAQELFDYFRL